MQLTALSPITKAEIDKAYSKDEYRQQRQNLTSSGHVDTCLLHYQIAMGQRDDTCLTLAKKLADKSSLKLNVADKNFFQLTPLMLAILMGRRNVASGIAALLNKTQINAIDQYGFSALHHAALCRPEFTDELISKGADPAKRTPLLGTYENIKVYGGHTPAPVSTNVKGLDPELRKLIPIEHLSPDRFSILTNGLQQLRSLPLYLGVNGARELWQSQTHEELTVQVALINTYQDKLDAYFANPPTLVLKQTPLLAGLQNSIGLFAGQDIKEGSIIDEYGGVCRGHEIPDGGYVYANFDGKLIGGASTRVNCGFPNALLLPMVYQGSNRLFLIAIDCIEKGGDLRISYGPRYQHLVDGPQVILGGEEMKAFFSKIMKDGGAEGRSLKSNNRELGMRDDAVEHFHHYLKYYGYRYKATFPLVYPSALIYLTCHNVVKPQVWLDALNLHPDSILCSKGMVIELKKRFPKNYSSVLNLCNTLKVLEDSITKYPWSQPWVDATKQWALKFLGKEHVSVISLCLCRAANEIPIQQFRPDNVEYYLEKIYHEVKKMIV